jgi:hypothetical protein
VLDSVGVLGSSLDVTGLLSRSPDVLPSVSIVNAAGE